MNQLSNRSTRAKTVDTTSTRSLLESQLDYIRTVVKRDFDKRECEVCGNSVLLKDMESVTIDEEQTQALICPLCFNHVEDNRYLPEYEAEQKDISYNEVVNENCRDLIF